MSFISVFTELILMGKMKTFKLIIEYDGTAYHGWQRQTTDASIQDEIEKALAVMTRQSITLAGSGRTDAGVHALGQTASFRCDTTLTADIFQKGLNSLLPEDIVIKSCTQVDNEFHARFNAKTKTYRYRIRNTPIPSALCRRYAWHIRKPLDIAAMQKAGKCLIGTHDFKAFQGQGSHVETTIRSLFAFDICSEAHMVFCDITGDGFLRFMVRNIVGTLVDVGIGKITTEEFKQILLSKDRSLAGATAPAHGLFLVKVEYGGK